MAVAMVGSVVGGGMSLLLLVVLGRLLTQRSFALLVLAVNMLTALPALTIAGADYATVRFVSAADTPGRKRGAMVTPLTLVVAGNLVVAAALFSLAGPLAVEVFHQPGFTGPLRACALVLPLTVAAQMLAAAVGGLERASGEMTRKVVEQGGRLLLGVLAVSLGLGVTGVVHGMGLAALASAVAVALILSRVVPRGGALERIAVRRVVSFAWPQAVANGAGQAWLLVVLAALSRFAGARDVALYGAAVTIARVPVLIYNSFALRFAPTVSRLWQERRHDDLDGLLKSVTRWVTMTSGPLFAVLLALPSGLLRIFGPAYSAGWPVLVVCAAAMLVDSVTGPVERALIMTGRVRLEMLANTGTALVTIGPALLLIRAFGALGLAWSLLLYNVALNALKVWFVRRALHLNPMSAAVAGPLIAAAAAAGCVLLVAGETSAARSLAGTITAAVALLCGYVVLLVGVVGVSTTDRAVLHAALRSRQT